MTNADRFLDAYAQIEHELKKELNLKRHVRFYELLDLACKKNPVVRRYKFDLQEYGDLRNAIVHNRGGGKVIAQPNDDTVKKIERIAGLLTKPPRVISFFQKEVITVAAEEPLSKALRLLDRYNYSQLPIIKKDVIAGLLTSNMIVRWMAAALENDCIGLQEVCVRDLLSFSGKKDNYKIVAAMTSLYEVQDLFCLYQAKAHKLEAVLITRNGRPEEKILGIITNLDLPLLQRQL
jgi:predicted transcriptional regulator